MAANQIKVLILLLIFQLNVLFGQKETHFVGRRSTIVHLFDWNWLDIAEECENFLGPNEYAGVQISPPSEHLILRNRPWWERYQVVSYQLTSRSGTELELREMIERCNAVGVRIYVDAIISHMSAKISNNTLGTAGSSVDYDHMLYPAVPYGPLDFNTPCTINDTNNAFEVRNCQLSGLLDLNQSVPYVRNTIAKYMNTLVDMGVAGFRIDSAKNMWPEDLYAIFSQLNSLKRDFNFSRCARPYIYHEVIELDDETAIKANDYVLIGDVTEFKYSHLLGRLFRGYNELKQLQNWGPKMGLLASHNALVFIDYHNNQHPHADGKSGDEVLDFKNGEQYKIALIFMLAHPYGKVTRIISSINFSNRAKGPPMNADGTKSASPKFLKNGQCDTSDGWICEHRWPEIVKMVEFRNRVDPYADLNHWWDNGQNQIAFGRGKVAFIAINMNTQKEMKVKVQTALPAGIYCDILNGKIIRADSICTGRQFNIGKTGQIQMNLPPGPNAIVIHIDFIVE